MNRTTLANSSACGFKKNDARTYRNKKAFGERAMSSSFESMSHQEIRSLHQDLTYFVEDYVAKMRNNHDARIAQFERCNTKGTHITCPISGCNNVDFFECNLRLAEKYGGGARIKGEIAADGGTPFVRIIAPIKKLRGHSAPTRTVRRAPPAFQTLITLLSVDLLLVGGLYWKIMLAG